MKLWLRIKRIFGFHQKRRRVHGIYVGCYCEICNTVLKGGTKTQHMREKHPEKIVISGAR